MTQPLRISSELLPSAAFGAPTPHRSSGFVLFAPERISLGAAVPDKSAALHEIGRLAQRRGGPTAGEIARWLARREARGSTALGLGAALAHAHVPRLHAPMAVYVRPAQGIAFDAPDGMAVSDILALLVPRPATAAHFELLARLRQRLAHPALRKELAHCDARTTCASCSRAGSGPSTDPGMARPGLGAEPVEQSRHHTGRAPEQSDSLLF